MNKLMMPLALAAALVTMAGCQSGPDSASRADSTASGDKIAEIAGDKTMTADVMRRSHERGTFDDALVLAMQDSSLAADVLAALKADPRFAAMFGGPDSAGSTPRATTAARTASKSTARTVTSRGTASSGDALDKTERTVQKANEKLDQAARIKQQAEEARRKAEGILKPR
jgi:hypothetical protein